MSVLLTLSVLNMKELRRDFIGLFFSFAVPVFLLFAFGAAARQPVSPRWSVVVTQSHGEMASERIAEDLTATGLVRVRRTNAKTAGEVLKAGDIDAIVSTDDVHDSVRTVRVTTPTLNEPLVAFVELAVNRTLDDNKAVVVKSDTLSDYQGLDKFQRLFPALVGLALLQLGLFGTATPILAARARGTLRHYALTPVSIGTVMLSHVLTRVIIAAAQVIIMFAIGMWAFKLQLPDNLIELLLIYLLGGATLIALGFVLAGVAPTTSAGNYAVVLVNFLMMFMGDVFVSTVSRTANVTSLVSVMLPITYLSDASRQLMSGMAGRFDLATDVAALGFFLGLFVFVGMRTFKFDMKSGRL